MKEFDEAFDFALRTKGYSEGTIRFIHVLAWTSSVAALIAMVAAVFWGLRRFNIWPFGSKATDTKSVNEEPPRDEVAWESKDE